MTAALPRQFTRKYRNVKTTVDGIKFDSKAEARRYGKLKLMQRAGLIKGLTPHPRFALTVEGKVIGHFTPDASYFENGLYIAEDTKSPATAKETAYRLRVKLFQALYPDIVFRENGGKSITPWTPRKRA